MRDDHPRERLARLLQRSPSAERWRRALERVSLADDDPLWAQLRRWPAALRRVDITEDPWVSADALRAAGQLLITLDERLDWLTLVDAPLALEGLGVAGLSSGQLPALRELLQSPGLTTPTPHVYVELDALAASEAREALELLLGAPARVQGLSLDLRGLEEASLDAVSGWLADSLDSSVLTELQLHLDPSQREGVDRLLTFVEARLRRLRRLSLVGLSRGARARILATLRREPSALVALELDELSDDDALALLTAPRLAEVARLSLWPGPFGWFADQLRDRPRERWATWASHPHLQRWLQDVLRRGGRSPQERLALPGPEAIAELYLRDARDAWIPQGLVDAARLRPVLFHPDGRPRTFPGVVTLSFGDGWLGPLLPELFAAGHGMFPELRGLDLTHCALLDSAAYRALGRSTLLEPERRVAMRWRVFSRDLNSWRDEGAEMLALMLDEDLPISLRRELWEPVREYIAMLDAEDARRELARHAIAVPASRSVRALRGALRGALPKEVRRRSLLRSRRWPSDQVA